MIRQSDRHQAAQEVSSDQQKTPNSAAQWCALGDKHSGLYGMLTISGDEAEHFLQGQASCDVSMLKMHGRHAIPGTLCNRKGRMFCSFLLAKTDEHTLALRMRRDLIEGTHHALRRYIAFSKAEARDVSADFALFGGIGVEAQGVMRDSASALGGLYFDLGDERGELWVRAADGAKLRKQLATLGEESEEQAWRLAGIRAGHAELCADTRDLFVPQMLALDVRVGGRDSAVSYTKGCYTGQEVVARLRYRGGVKRHLFHAVSTAAPHAGETIFAPGGRVAGTVIDAACGQANKDKELLIVLNDALAQDALYCKISDQPLAVRDLRPVATEQEPETTPIRPSPQNV